MPGLRTRHVATALLALLGTLGAGCSSGRSTGLDEDPLVVTKVADSEELVIRNESAQPIFTYVVDRAQAARINWAPCADVSRCPPPLGPGESQRVPWPAPDSLSTAGERAAIVYWWRPTPAGVMYASHTDIESIVVPLP